MEEIKKTTDELIQEIAQNFTELKHEKTKIGNKLQSCIDSIDAFLHSVGM